MEFDFISWLSDLPGLLIAQLKSDKTKKHAYFGMRKVSVDAPTKLSSCHKFAHVDFSCFARGWHATGCVGRLGGSERHSGRLLSYTSGCPYNVIFIIRCRGGMSRAVSRLFIIIQPCL